MTNGHSIGQNPLCIPKTVVLRYVVAAYLNLRSRSLTTVSVSKPKLLSTVPLKPCQYTYDASYTTSSSVIAYVAFFQALMYFIQVF